MIEDLAILRARFDAAYDHPAPVIRANRPSQDVADILRASISFVPGASQRSSTGRTQYRQTQLGRIIAVIRDKKGEGTGAANELAQHIRDIFEEWSTENLWCGGADVDVYEDQGYEIRISIPWRSSRLKNRPA
jgi:hypothetical protein